jgi:hypothetical protein
MPAHVEGDLLAEAVKPSVRRFAGVVTLTIVEVLLSVELVLLFWRVGKSFVLGEYVSGPMLLNAAALIAALILTGHMVANLFFPSLRDRFRREFARRSEATVDAAWQRAEFVLRDHVDSADRLAQQGRGLLQTIGEIVQSLARPAEDDRELQRLFGDEAAPAAAPCLPTEAPAPMPERRRVPKFD